MPDRPYFGDALDAQVEVFSQAVDDCLELYRSSANAWNRSLPANVAARAGAATLDLMDDLARGLMIKIFLTIVQADRRFTIEERQLGQVLIAKLWGRELASDEVGPVLRELIAMADKFDWFQLVRPFEDVPVLRDRATQVETIAMRFGNLVAKADGTLAPEEAFQLKGLLGEISRHLRPVPLAQESPPPGTPQCQEIRAAPGRHANARGRGGSRWLRSACGRFAAFADRWGAAAGGARLARRVDRLGLRSRTKSAS